MEWLKLGIRIRGITPSLLQCFERSMTVWSQEPSSENRGTWRVSWNLTQSTQNTQITLPFKTVGDKIWCRLEHHNRPLCTHLFQFISIYHPEYWRHFTVYPGLSHFSSTNCRGLQLTVCKVKSWLEGKLTSRMLVQCNNVFNGDSYDMTLHIKCQSQ